MQTTSSNGWTPLWEPTPTELTILLLALWFVPGLVGVAIVLWKHQRSPIENVRFWIRQCLIFSPGGWVIALLI